MTIINHSKPILLWAKAVKISCIPLGSSGRQFSSEIKRGPIREEDPLNLKPLAEHLAARIEEKYQHTPTVEPGTEHWPIHADEHEKILRHWYEERRQFIENVEQQRPKMYTPSELERKLLMWTGMYSARSEMPEKLNSFQVQKHRKSIGNRIFFFLFSMYAGLHWIYRQDDNEKF